MKPGFRGLMKRNDGFTDKEKLFAQEYIEDFDTLRAMRAAGFTGTDNGLRVRACKIKSKPVVRSYIEELQAEMEERSGISRLRVLREYAKIAFGPGIGEFFTTWTTTKKLSGLTKAQKDMISEITVGTYMGEQSVKIKLHDRIRALDSIVKMLGFDAPQKIDLATLGKQLLPTPEIKVYNVGPPLADNEDKVKT